MANHTIFVRDEEKWNGYRMWAAERGISMSEAIAAALEWYIDAKCLKCEQIASIASEQEIKSETGHK